MKVDLITDLMEKYRLFSKEHKDGIFITSKELSEILPIVERGIDKKNTEDGAAIVYDCSVNINDEIGNELNKSKKLKRHHNILRDIRDDLWYYGKYPQFIDNKNIEDMIIYREKGYKDRSGKWNPVYNLTDDGFLIVTSRYDRAIRGLLVTLWKKIKDEKPEVFEQIKFTKTKVDLTMGQWQRYRDRIHEIATMWTESNYGLSGNESEDLDQMEQNQIRFENMIREVNREFGLGEEEGMDFIL